MKKSLFILNNAHLLVPLQHENDGKATYCFDGVVGSVPADAVVVVVSYTSRDSSGRG